MSIVSDSNHWMFISSNGGLSAGRKNAEYALFPYYTDDKITEAAEITGSKSIFRIEKEGQEIIWEPYSIRNEGRFNITQNLYKSWLGNKVIFEEVNHDLELTFRYSWKSSDRFGFVRESTLINTSDKELRLKYVDGIQNILPYGVGSTLQNQTSNLVDAYKRSELDLKSGIGIFGLSAIIVDKAEPSEALKANTVWSSGHNNPIHLLSSLQLDNFRKGLSVSKESDIKAEKGAYFIHDRLSIPPHGQKEWLIVADVNKDHSSIVQLSEFLKNEEDVKQIIEQDVKSGDDRLLNLIGASDGLQMSADRLKDIRHYSNTLFNIMRGGIFDNNYQIEKTDFIKYLANANPQIFENEQGSVRSLPDQFSISDIQKLRDRSDDANFQRLCMEYMPLKFSRRHGDPSRPWNRFSINTKSEIDGSKVLDYEGNWRDIFQNWEALAISYPGFIDSMIHKFLNASTFDGYNPYRVTKSGLDWETIEPDDPWSYIGYWGDHQVIYLLKLLEICERHFPDKLASYFDQELFVYANVPYKIKPYQEILNNPKDTIIFDHQSDQRIRGIMETEGADSVLLRDRNGTIFNVNFIEKMLAMVLSKMSNFIPEGGIWMNTQRPEWNDANNALVGNGVSMVTLYYLIRFFKFFKRLLSTGTIGEVSVSSELAEFLNNISITLSQHQNLLSDSISDRNRKLIVDALGTAGSDYRNKVYNSSFSGEQSSISLSDIDQFVHLSLRFLEHSAHANRRDDQLYHAYNLLTIAGNNEISIAHLDEMLEGQVAVLSSGILTDDEALDLLNALKNSKLYRKDQSSYILYPKKELPGFLEKNVIPSSGITKIPSLTKLVEQGKSQIFLKDLNGEYHFNGNFKNANDLKTAIDAFATPESEQISEKERTQILQLFEEVFNHKAFTGRSGTFYGYEGLGSIYWHMVSKLQLAVQECCLFVITNKASEEVINALIAHYYEINEGIGVHKSPSVYGAFPTDPYSHTPGGKGAQQPGMTGQVKEDILCRFGELGVFVQKSQLTFDPCLLKKDEFLKSPEKFTYVDIKGETRTLQLEEGSLCFTYCQVPIVYILSETNSVEIINKNGTSSTFGLLQLDTPISREIFNRTGSIKRINVRLIASQLN